MRLFRNFIAPALLTSLILIPGRGVAQTPDKMSYQAVVRNSSGALVINKPLGMRIQILQGSVTGNSVYTETHVLTSNANGLVSMEVGGGTVVSGSFSAIDWSAGPYFIKTEADPEGGANYSITGVSQLLSVPYALYAKHSGTPGPKGDKGDTGVAGPQGPIGPQGPAGSQWYTGSGPAPITLGQANELYLNTANGDYYKKTDANTWAYQGNLTGPPGLPGEDGATWLTGNGIPGSSAGKIDDLYLDTASGDFYRKTNGDVWIIAGNLRGPEGKDGSNGATWYTGGVTPASSTGVINDLYLDTASSNYYKKTSNTTWTLQGNIEGSEGKDGATWLTGSGAPGSLGNINDLYLDTTNGFYYKKTGTNTWTFQNSLTGAKGSDGSFWYTGAGMPSSSLGQVNDMYLDTVSAKYYKKTGASSWTQQGTLLGPTNFSGKKNYVVKFTGTNTGGNSQIYDSAYIGINTNIPKGKLHIKGGEDVSQLLIDANSTQSNKNPLIRLRNSSGEDLLWIHTDDTSNLFIGRNAGRMNNNTGGQFNTLLGSGAGYSNTSGFYNTAAGYYALHSNSTGESNTAFGTLTLYSNKASNNTGVGFKVLGNNTSGAKNVGVGGYALNGNTTGGNNTAQGFQALNANSIGNNNTAIGYEALYSNDAGSNATAIGYNAMRYANTSTTAFTNYNVAVGYEALRGSTSASSNTGNYNTALGYQTLLSNTSGSINTAIGTYSLYSNSTGGNNTACGTSALSFNSTGGYNAAFGYGALSSNVAGKNATALGANAMLYSNSTSTAFTNSNVAVGFEALRGSTTASSNTGNSNTALGYQTLLNNTGGNHNTISGHNALYNNTNGGSNTASGSSVLRSNTTGFSNTASGREALYMNTTGSGNTAIGTEALYYNNAGGYSTGIGYRAMYYANSTTTAFINYNIAIGSEALRGSTTPSSNTGNYNIALGYRSMLNNSSGNYNSASGYQALYSNTTGDANTANGHEALYSNTTGDSNTVIGFQADANSGTYSNSSAFGNKAAITASNQVRIGNSSVTSIGGQVSWSTLSDARTKKDVESSVPGLAFITKLRPVTYTYDLNAIEKLTWPNGRPKIQGEGPDNNLNTSAKQTTRFTGFLAQEVEEAARSIGYDFSAIDAPDNATDLYSLRYAEFVVPLVKAVQEQQEIIERQGRVIEELKAKDESYIKLLTGLQERISKLEGINIK